MAEAITWLGRLTPTTVTATFSGISQDYTHLIAKGYCQADSDSTSAWTNNDGYINFNGDYGTGAHYGYMHQFFYGYITNPTKQMSKNQNATEMWMATARKQYSGSNTNSWSTITAKIYNYTSTSTTSQAKKAVMWWAGINNLANDCFYSNSTNLLTNDSAAITSLGFRNSNGWVSGTIFDLYGVKVG